MKTYPFTIWQLNAIENLGAFSGTLDYKDGDKEENFLIESLGPDYAENSFEWSRDKWESGYNEEVCYYSLKYQIS